MLRSMYAGISGMKGFQTKLDVVGNNIANVNTSGYKKARVSFQDMMSQTLSGAEGPTNTRGGVNPQQVGLGSQLGSIDNIHTQGNRQTTNRILDLALEGDGMFVLGKDLSYNAGNRASSGVDMQDTPLSFTRAGNFYLDDEGYVVNPDGLYLLGNVNPDGSKVDDYLGKIQIPQDAASFSIQGDGLVTYVNGSGNVQSAGQILLAKFSNPGGLQKTGSNLYQITNNAGVFTDDGNFDTIDDLVIPEENGSATIVSGALEMSNVDLAEEFTEMITAQRGFQANTRIITTSDEILQELVNLKR
ncbi:flagellar basal body rod protein FlgG [Aquibacillus salsiterrae]|uniref:Flagellar hook protein FlgE n=1 Tax=Aquibacillus salsiterrae TaxID=2950439 RepID=A0A9X3WFB9_9BACI|nr:flagellar basal body rod protein FlgG [Aquibacillus salsiterrae]MDC3416389.1 flagellar basal body rod protein FlgG [Aquibacillus salsiterrae]